MEMNSTYRISGSALPIIPLPFRNGKRSISPCVSDAESLIVFAC
ncbi:hypothetical protein [Muriicola soli]|nr:hypothetical protein [Muriicola soli]